MRARVTAVRGRSWASKTATKIWVSNVLAKQGRDILVMIVQMAVKRALPTKRTKPVMVSMITAEKKLREMSSKHSRAAVQKLYPCIAT